MKSAKHQSGLVCPHCGGRRFRVVNTKHIGTRVIRRRRCLKCKTALATKELPIGQV